MPGSKSVKIISIYYLYRSKFRPIEAVAECQRRSFFFTFRTLLLFSSTLHADVCLCWLYSNCEDRELQFDKSIAPNVHVFSDGTCKWFLPGRFSTPCPVDISWFPFDNQTCSLTFQSWLYSGFKLNLTAASDVVETLVMNGEWNLIGTCTHCRILSV